MKQKKKKNLQDDIGKTALFESPAVVEIYCSWIAQCSYPWHWRLYTCSFKLLQDLGSRIRCLLFHCRAEKDPKVRFKDVVNSQDTAETIPPRHAAENKCLDMSKSRSAIKKVQRMQGSY